MIDDGFDIDKYWDRYNDDAKDLDCMASMIGFKYHILFNNYIYVYGSENEKDDSEFRGYIIDKNGEIVYSDIKFIAPLIETKDLSEYNKKIEDKASEIQRDDKESLSKYSNKLRPLILQYYAIFTEKIEHYNFSSDIVNAYQVVDLFDSIQHLLEDVPIKLLRFDGSKHTGVIKLRNFKTEYNPSNQSFKPRASDFSIYFHNKIYHAHLKYMENKQDSPVKYFLSTK